MSFCFKTPVYSVNTLKKGTQKLVLFGKNYTTSATVLNMVKSPTTVQMPSDIWRTVGDRVKAIAALHQED